MKITIEIPDWAQERNIYVMAGVELLATKRWDEEVVHVKDGRCSLCGDCCENKKNWIFPLNKGTCVHLNNQIDGTRECRLGSLRPHGCNIDDPVSLERCTITHKETDLEGNML